MMLRVTVLCVGKLKEAFWRQASAEYEKRMGSFCRLSVIEIEEERLPDSPSQAQIDQGLQNEGRRLLAKVPDGAAVITLCIEGKMLTSPQLAERIEELALRGHSDIVLIIGSSHGLAPAVKEASSLRLSMSGMTFPHQLARVMLLEQLYRAFQINAGGKYHK